MVFGKDGGRPGPGHLAGTRSRLILALVLAATWIACAPSRAKAATFKLLVTDSSVQKPVALREVEVGVETSGPVAKVTYDLTFRSSHANTLEGTFYFAVPEGAHVDAFGMWVAGRYQSSAIVPAKQGRAAYEGIVRRGVDPALLEWTAGNVFKMRVFPIVRGQDNKVRIVLGVPARLERGAATFPFPLDFGRADRFAISFRGASPAGAIRVEGLPGGTFELRPKQGNVFRRVFGKAGGRAFDVTKDFGAVETPPARAFVVSDFAADSTVRVAREDVDGERVFELAHVPSLPRSRRPAPRTAVLV